MEPLVSVIIPVYNRESTILRSLNSVLRQTYYNIEVIIVDDCSTDNTIQVIETCMDDRVELVRLPSNCGANTARNRGIEQASGLFIAFQDSDDEWMANKLEKQVRYMLETGVAASYCPYILYGYNKCLIIPSEYLDHNYCEFDIKNSLKKCNIIGTPTLIVKKEVFSVIGMFDEEMERLQDYELVIRLSQKYKIGYIDEPLVKAFRSSKSITSNNKVLADTYIKLLERHIHFLDFDSLVYNYLESCYFFENSSADWTDIDKVLSVVRNCGEKKLEEECYRIAIRYLYEQLGTARDAIREWYYFYERHIQSHEFAIYGAGAYGHKVYNRLKEQDRVPRYFIVTEQSEIKDIEGIPVIALTECNDEDIPVIIAVSRNIQTELIQNLLHRRMNKFCIYPFGN